MDINLDYTYKNASVTIIVEDDCITTAKIYIGGAMVDSFDVLTKDGKDVPFSRATINEVKKMCRDSIDSKWNEDLVALNRAEG